MLIRVLAAVRLVAQTAIRNVTTLVNSALGLNISLLPYLFSIILSLLFQPDIFDKCLISRSQHPDPLKETGC